MFYYIFFSFNKTIWIHKIYIYLLTHSLMEVLPLYTDVCICIRELISKCVMFVYENSITLSVFFFFLLFVCFHSDVIFVLIL